MAKLVLACSIVALLALAASAQAGTVWFASTPGVDQAQLVTSSLFDADPTSALASIDDTAWQPAVACYVNGAWPWQTDTTVPYATWISTAYLAESTSNGDSWRWFRRVVSLPSDSYGFSGTITCDADNAELAYVNRVPVGSDGTLFGPSSPDQRWSTIDTFPIDSALLHGGDNEFLFLVRNYGGGGGESNPTGLIYKISVSVPGAWPAFPDVQPGYWAYDEIGACYLNGIVAGYPDGLYHPTDEVRRSQMAVFIARALAKGDQQVPTGPATATFPDVPASGYGEDGLQPYWAYKYIEYCAAHGIVSGYPDGSYSPEEAVDRGQMAVYIARAAAGSDAAVPEPPATMPPTFPDVPGPGNAWAWCRKYVEYAASRGIVKGYPDGAYHPEVVVTRDQMAVYIQRAFGLQP